MGDKIEKNYKQTEQIKCYLDEMGMVDHANVKELAKRKLVIVGHLF